MADTLVEGVVRNLLDRQALFMAWNSPSVGVVVFIDAAEDLNYRRTVDGGSSWGTLLELSGSGVETFACWYDQWTQGVAGTLLHCAWVDSGASEVRYNYIDLSDGSKGMERTVDSTVTVSTSESLNRIAITKAVGGDIHISFSTQTEIGSIKSSDNFATAGTTTANMFEVATQEDWLLLYPADTGDTADIAGLFWDKSANEISVKIYDNSVNSIALEQSLATGMVDDAVNINMCGSIRFTDKHLLVAAHSDEDTAGDDIRTWDVPLDSVASIAPIAKANAITDQAESAQVSIVINQQNDDVYVAYIKGNPTWQSLTDVVFHKSTDGMGSWGTEQVYSETTDDIQHLNGGRSINDNGGRIQWVFYNDDLSDLFINEVNDIEIAAAAPSGAGTELFEISHHMRGGFNSMHGGFSA